MSLKKDAPWRRPVQHVGAGHAMACPRVYTIITHTWHPTQKE